MIIIEVRFGAINGNAITIDSALSGTSTNPVQNKVIKAALDALQNQISNIASQIPKEVVSVEDAEALYDIENPSTEVVYITEDTGEIYTYNGEEFVLSTNNVIDGTIYVDDIGSLIDMTLASGKAYPVVCVTAASGDDPATTESYTLNVSDNARTLVAKDGFATIVSGAWSWSKYSFKGHTHTTSDISGLSTAIANATSGKQDKTDDNLNTTDKTVVGAINSLLAQMQLIIHAFTIDFQDYRETVQMRNLKGAIKLTRILCDNVSTLQLSNNGTTQTISLTNGEWTGEISVAADALLVWQIGRTTGGSIAEINVQYNYVS